MKRLSLVLPALTLALTAPAFAHNGKGSVRMTEAQLRESMRKLWEDHVTHTAFFYTAAISGGDDKEGNASALDEATKRWYRNADDISAFLAGANTPRPSEKERQ